MAPNITSSSAPTRSETNELGHDTSKFVQRHPHNVPSANSSKGEHKMRSPKAKPQVDENGWTVVSATKKVEPGSQKPTSLPPSSPRTCQNQFDALQTHEDTHQARDQGRECKKLVLGNDKMSLPSPKLAAKSVEGSRATSNTSSSWVDVCKFPLTAPKATAPSHNELSLTKAEAKAQIIPKSSDFPNILTSQLPQIPQARASWANVASSTPVEAENPTTKLSVDVCDPTKDEKGPSVVTEVPLEVDVLAAPPILPETITLPAVSHANTSMSPSFAGSATPAIETTGLSPQPNSSSAKPLPSSPSPIREQSSDNLLVMIRQERQCLLEGPQITIYVGEIAITGISKRAAMAASSVLNKHFTKHPELLECRFSTGYMDPDAIQLLLVTWMEPMCREFEAYAVPVQETFDGNIALLRASRFLGMERYTRDILTGHISYLKSHLPSYDEIVAVEQNTTSEKDPLWTNMVNHLCHDRFKGLMPDPREFAAFLEKHPKLKKAMESADAYFSGIAKQKWGAIKAERRQRWETNQAEKKVRLAQKQAVT
ncbi:uncharacterized protein K460DRAFT_396490 [Cucurbitaria berberidis CBS 394.84]|uniref:Uncharacterized protein n=1 Tax=Cucurbitaria berberidis CBS 394.84 TaxID=1168544 RepID=A0A9P4GDA6_9PLEO|nr:uncharacterized protein K460DRAFT_396490 [Cucurbitaria berberidis CBS 394.84]KAF1843100.1 hypothetical protein K460DRAFT_396490 [Cucurbitaria berberidis CBS 394.84]